MVTSKNLESIRKRTLRIGAWLAIAGVTMFAGIWLCAALDLDNKILISIARVMVTLSIVGIAMMLVALSLKVVQKGNKGQTIFAKITATIEVLWGIVCLVAIWSYDAVRSTCTIGVLDCETIQVPWSDVPIESCPYSIRGPEIVCDEMIGLKIASVVTVAMTVLVLVECGMLWTMKKSGKNKRNCGRKSKNKCGAR